MSHSDDKASKAQKHSSSSERGIVIAGGSGKAAAVDMDVDQPDKPDTKVFDLGSPVSPLGGTSRGATGASSLFTNTSSSSGSSGSFTGRNSSRAVLNKPEGGGGGSRNHSGELSGSTASSPRNAGGSGTPPTPGHRRTGSTPLIYAAGAGGSTATSPATNVLPTGNICPSGKIGTGMMHQNNPRSDVLGSGMANYGHGSIIRGTGRPTSEMRPFGANDLQAVIKRAMASSNPEEAKSVGNEMYKKGMYAEALRLYERAIQLSPFNAACHSNRAAALMAMGKIGEAVKECEEAVRLDRSYGRAHQRLASLYIRLGQVENARKHLNLMGELPDPSDMQKLQVIDRHLKKCSDSRKIGDWNSVLRESEAAINAGADFSPLFASKSEALLQLHRLRDADSALTNMNRLRTLTPSSSQTKFFGMYHNTYLFFVKAQVDMAMGRFEDAAKAASTARASDPQNVQIAVVLDNVALVVQSRTQGNELFKAEKFANALVAYESGLKFDPFNPFLYCNRAACHFKLGRFLRSIEDCTGALKYLPDYSRALRRRADSFLKLERWAEAVQDYEVLKKEFPQDSEVAENLFHAQVALKTSRGEQISNMSFGGEVEKIGGVEQFMSAKSLPGVSVFYFMAEANKQCLQISPFVDILCQKYPPVKFHKVNVQLSQELATMENVRVVPTFKFYKNGKKLKEMVCPSQEVLEYSVKHYCL